MARFIELRKRLAIVESHRVGIVRSRGDAAQRPNPNLPALGFDALPCYLMRIGCTGSLLLETIPPATLERAHNLSSRRHECCLEYSSHDHCCRQIAGHSPVIAAEAAGPASSPLAYGQVPV